MGSERLPNLVWPKASANAVLIVCFLVATNKKKKSLYRLYNVQDIVLPLIMACAKATRMRKSARASQSGAVAFWQDLFGSAQRLSFIKGHGQLG